MESIMVLMGTTAGVDGVDSGIVIALNRDVRGGWWGGAAAAISTSEASKRSSCVSRIGVWRGNGEIHCGTCMFKGPVPADHVTCRWG